MKNKKFLVIMLILILLGSGLLVYYNLFMKEDKDKETLEKEYTFNNEYGTFNIAADKALECRGTAGASNNVFYIVDGNLYLYSEGSVNELYAMNIDDIYYEKEQSDIIVVVTNSDTLIIKESSYLKYLKDEVVEDNLKEFKFSTAYGEVKINADKALACRGTAGASNNIFYIKDKNLYKYVDGSEDELYATGVMDMSFDNKNVELINVVLAEDSNVISKSTYISYISVVLNQFVFETDNGQVKINADMALACRGTAGASNNIFYMIDGNLYLYSGNKVNELYAKDVDNIYYEKEQSDIIVVDTNSDTLIIKESSYLKYLKDEVVEDNLKEFKFSTAYGEVKINVDKALACQGWSGASNTIFYIKDKNLYKYVDGSEDELYAKNVDDIYYETVQTDVMTVSINENTVVLKEETYLKYLNKVNNLKEFKFSTAYGEVKINADKALVCQGWSGASNTIFYIKDKNLYKYVDGSEDELYAKNVDDIYYETVQTDVMTVSINDNTVILKNETYLKYTK